MERVRLFFFLSAVGVLMFDLFAIMLDRAYVDWPIFIVFLYGPTALVLSLIKARERRIDVGCATAIVACSILFVLTREVLTLRIPGWIDNDLRLFLIFNMGLFLAGITIGTLALLYRLIRRHGLLGFERKPAA